MLLQVPLRLRHDLLLYLNLDLAPLLSLLNPQQLLLRTIQHDPLNLFQNLIVRPIRLLDLLLLGQSQHRQRIINLSFLILFR